jgi:hypothetical protein
MNDYPSTAKFLTIAEKEEVTRRLEQDRSALAEEFDMKYFWDAIKDWKIWVHMVRFTWDILLHVLGADYIVQFITIGIYTPLYSYSLFLPTIVRTLGYSNETAQLMTAPPYVVACVICVAGGYLADRHGQRGIYMIGFGLLS